ncbi:MULTISPECIES: protein-export chaperone SecB [Thermodesulfovibrio]|uniref:protein-export chaperone SecB n=1 Tax=Thermodesulfovibrio TaxID=28261 RepID=UPI0026271977|nr:protein-export chaperone SecB [Thermodesulfovibrio sp.]
MQVKFKIETIRQIECFFALNPEFKPEKGKKYGIALGFDISFKKQRKKIAVIFKFFSEEKNQPFVFRIIQQGIFDFETVPKSEELEKIVHINCASIMFPFIRESIADLTRKAGVPPLILDPINFVAIYEDMKKKSNKN